MLTIDRDIQYRAQQSLAEAVRETTRPGGTVIVMNPHTGEILAMATYPWFDPNGFAEANPNDLRSRAVTDVYEPGSVNKVITVSAALQAGTINPRTRFVVPDQFRVYDATIHDAETHPTETMTPADILSISSNIGAIKIANTLGQQRFDRYMTRFGFGQTTGLGFPGESGGILPPVDTWSGVEPGDDGVRPGARRHAAADGLGVRDDRQRRRVDRAASGSRHGGRERRVPAGAAADDAPRGVDGNGRDGDADARLRGRDRHRRPGPDPRVLGRRQDGDGARAAPDRAGYTHKTIASFIGFAPASRPSLVVAAVLDDPSTIYGGVAAAPLFKDVARFALARLRIPPAAKPPTPPHAVRPG